jgi:hypothetical protein
VVSDHSPVTAVGGRDGRETRTAPGALRPEPLRCPGQPSGANHPPLVDLLALASRSTSHRPSCPEARRAMPRSRPGRRLPDPVAVTVPPRRSDGSETPSQHREDRCPASQLGWLPVPRPGLPRVLDRRTGRPPGAATVAFVPCTRAADPNLYPKAWNGAVFRSRHHPKVTPADSDPRPGRRCARRYEGTHCPRHHRRSSTIFESTRFSPELLRYPQAGVGSSTVRAQLPHSCAGTADPHGGPTSARSRSIRWSLPPR